MNLLPQMNVELDIISIWPSTCQECTESDKLQNEKRNLVHSGNRTRNLESYSLKHLVIIPSVRPSVVPSVCLTFPMMSKLLITWSLTNCWQTLTAAITIEPYGLEKKEEIWLSHMTKGPTFTEKSEKQHDNTKDATKNFDFTTITDRIKTASWGTSSHPNDVVKPVYERSTFPLTVTAV